MGEPAATVPVTVRYFAAARAAAGTPQEQISVPAAADARQLTVGDVLHVAVDLHGPALATVLARCSYLLDETAVHGPATPVRSGQVIDVLPPFAGG